MQKEIHIIGSFVMKNNTEKISIVIPAFNVERYIENLLNCLKKQTYKNLEIIIVNDGSSDKTESICKEFINKNKDMSFKYIYQKNSGVSAARNVGIKNATGEFLIFIDADDTISKKMVELLYNKQKESDYDFVFSNATIISKNIKTKSLILDEENFNLKESFFVSIFSNFVSKKIYNFSYEFSRSVWGKLYRRDLIKENNLYFDEKMFLFEDGFFNLCYLNSINKLSYISECVYNYYIDNGNSSRYRKNLLEEDSYKIEKINQKFSDLSFVINQAKYAYFIDLISNFVIKNINSSNSNLKFFEKRAELKKISSLNIYSIPLKNVQYKFLNVKKKFVLFCMRRKFFFLLIILLRDW